MSVPNNINDDELLGRAVFSSNQASRASKGNVDFRIFFYKNNRLLSVDRLDCCSKKILTSIQDKNAQERSRSFYGWAQIKAVIARRNNRMIHVVTTLDNPYHANIILPEDIEEDEQIAHAKELSSNAEWISRYNNIN